MFLTDSFDGGGEGGEVVYVGGVGVESGCEGCGLLVVGLVCSVEDIFETWVFL